MSQTLSCQYLSYDRPSHCLKHCGCSDTLPLARHNTSAHTAADTGDAAHKASRSPHYRLLRVVAEKICHWNRSRERGAEISRVTQRRGQWWDETNTTRWRKDAAGREIWEGDEHREYCEKKRKTKKEKMCIITKSKETLIWLQCKSKWRLLQ